MIKFKDSGPNFIEKIILKIKKPKSPPPRPTFEILQKLKLSIPMKHLKVKDPIVCKNSLPDFTVGKSYEIMEINESGFLIGPHVVVRNELNQLIEIPTWELINHFNVTK